jgi:hypothetical protein
LQDHGLAVQEWAELFRKVSGCRQGCATDENRDQGNVALQRCRQLEAHVVIRVQKPDRSLCGRT